MPSFERIRDRLPTLYRPDDHDHGEDVVALAVDDIAALELEPEVEPSFGVRRPMVVIELDEPARLRSVRLRPGRTPGLGYALACYPLGAGGVTTGRPAAVAGVRDGVATLATSFDYPRFALELRRRTLLTTFMLGVGELLDGADREAAEVLQSHWFEYADRARFSPFLARARQLRGLGPPAPDDRELLEFPYIHDLARLAAPLAIAPRRELGPRHELVEPYRQRIGRLVALHARGLGTVDAIERMVEAQLPVDLDAPPERLDRPFSIEESVPLGTVALDVRADPLRPEVVRPLMRWSVENDGLRSAPPIVYVGGVAAEGDEEAATADPLVERLDADGSLAGIGLGYRGTVPAGGSLRLRPAFTSWLALSHGIGRADAGPGDGGEPADPTAPGPWSAPPGAPDERVAALAQTDDHALWMATRGTEEGAAAGGALWRHDGRTWTAVASDLDAPRCLHEDGGDLLIGTDAGLLRMPLHPDGGDRTLQPVAGVETAVNAIERMAPGELWLGTATGLLRLGGAGPEPLALSEAGGTATEVFSLSRDGAGTVHLGTALGVFAHQPRVGAWHWYAGGEPTEQVPDWRPFVPDAAPGQRNFPAEDDVHLPPVRCVRRGRDGGLWLGTDAGIARYVARAARSGATFETVLEAFPDLSTGPVHAIAEDPRGELWFCTSRGLFRAGRRDIWHRHVRRWRKLGRIDTLYRPLLEELDDGPDQAGALADDPGRGAPVGPRGSWRYDRRGSRWQRLVGREWRDHRGEPRTFAAAAVRAVLWTDAVAADLLDGFEPVGTPSPASAEPVPESSLVVRCKLSAARIVDGGLPALPRVPPGRSTWRYLALEPDELPAPAEGPAWTSEGRHVPAASGSVDLPVPVSARLTTDDPPGSSQFDESLFAYRSAARVRFEWRPARRLSVLARLRRRAEGEVIDPAVLDRVWEGIEQVRPAGVRALLAIEETIVRGEEGG